MKKIEKQPEKLSSQSMSITEDQKRKLKRLFPEIFNEKKIDWEKLKRTLGEELDTGQERYNMTWPGKRECFQIIQEPSFGTLKPCKEESLDWDTTQNLFIEGDNLEVLKLLQRSYYGKVKMIYIDPPYNTGKDFIYPDRYSENLETYLEYTGQKDASGKKFSTNQETDGRFHSKWINMMYPRLFLARNLLRDDGVIFISIDDNEVTNLRKICDDIFGEENFLTQFIWKKRTGSNDAQNNASADHDYVICYKKYDLILNGIVKDFSNYSNPDNDPRGEWTKGDLTCNKTASERPNLYYPITDPKTGITYPCNSNRVWVYEKNRMLKLIEEGKVIFSKNKGTPTYKRHRSEVRSNKKPYSSIIETDMNFVATKKLRELLSGQYFDHPKGTDLIKQLIAQGSNKNDIILDFFAGSATTAHAVYEKNLEDSGNRKYICVQLPEPTQEKTEAYKAGYKNIAEIGKERIRRAVKKIREENKQRSLLDLGKNLDLGFKVFKLDQSNFRVWDGEIPKEKEKSKQIEMHMDDFIHSGSSDEDLLYEILIKTGFELTTKIEILKIENKKVYSVEDHALLICLEKEITKELILAMARLQPARVVCLDSGFNDNDWLKTNAVETMRSHNVRDFKTI